MALSPADLTQISALFATLLAEARIKISALPTIGSVTRNAVLPIVDAGSTQKIPISRLLSLSSTVVPVGQDLRAMDVSTIIDGSLFYTEGVLVVGDGGGGFWIYDAGSAATDNIGTIIAPDSGTGRFIRQYTGTVNAKWFGAQGNGVSNDYVPIQSAIDWITSLGGGALSFDAGNYLCLTELVGTTHLTLLGAGGKGNVEFASVLGSTYITGQHGGNSILNLVGCNGCFLQNIGIFGSNTSPPKCGLLLGRTVALGSAGDHTFSNITVSGYFTSCAVMSVASENNTWISPNIILNGGGAKVAFFTGQSPELGITNPAVYGGSNIATTYHGVNVINYVDDADAVGIYMDCGINTINHEWFGGFVAMKNGTYVKLRAGVVDNQNTPGPISFHGVSGEQLTGGSVDRGFLITSEALNYGISGLTITGARLPTTGGGLFIELAAPCFLKDSSIKVPAQNNTSSFAGVLTNTFVDFGTGDVPTFYGANGMKVLDGDFIVERTGAAAAKMIAKSIAGQNAGLEAYINNVLAAVFAAAADGNTYLDYQGELRGRTAAGVQQWSITAAGIATVKALFTPGAAVALVSSTAPLNNGAAAQNGTLTNAPAAGNPTKWVAINDGGTIRYVPAW